MAHTIEAKAPGKVLWLGGYSILERPNVGFVTTIDAYVHAASKLTEGDNGIRIRAPDFSLDIKGTIDRDTGRLNVERSKELNLIATTIEVALAYVLSKDVRLKGLDISTKNDEAFAYKISDKSRAKAVSKSGMGSSSAVVVATTASVLAAYNFDLYDDDALHKLSQLSHGLATGKVGSGFDIAAATYGSIKYTRYSPSIISDFPKDFSIEDISGIVKRKWDYNISKVALPKEFRTIMANFVNDAAITTSLVGSVNEFKKADPNAYSDLIRRMNDTAEKAIGALNSISENGYRREYRDRLIESFRENRALSKELGRRSNIDIESDESTKLINDSENNGAIIAKLPGAGGKDSIVAISESDEDSLRLRKFWKDKSYLDILDVKMQNSGIIFEKNHEKQKMA